jgi:hypothetical protein
MSAINITVLNALCEYTIDTDTELHTKKYDFSQLFEAFSNVFSNMSCTPADTKTKNKKNSIKESVIKNQIIADVAHLKLHNTTPVFHNWRCAESKYISIILWGMRLDDQTNPAELYNCMMSICAIKAELQSTNIIKVIEYVYERLVKLTNIDQLFAEYSEFITNNFYTMTYPSKIITPYPAQQAVMDLYKTSLDANTPLCINYSTETGSGKTYLSLALVKMHTALTKYNELTTNCFVFVCYNITVRKMILAMCDKLNIPACMVEADGVSFRGDVGPVFNLNRCAINIKAKNESGNSRRRRTNNNDNIIKKTWTDFDSLMKFGNNEEKIRNQFTYLNSIKNHTVSFNASLPQIYICDPECASIMVKIAPNSTVFIDEPDVDNKEIAEHYTNILKLCPKRTIIVSATLGDMMLYDGQFKTTHPDAVIETINYGTNGIHSTLISNGKIYLPHMLAENNVKFITQLKTTSIIKLYSPLAIAKMFEERKESLSDYFSFDTVNYNTIRQFIIKYFETAEFVIDKPFNYHVIDKIFTTDNYLLKGQTLSISNEPYKQALKSEGKLFGEYNIHDARRKFNEELTIYTTTMNKILNNNMSGGKRCDRETLDSKIAEHSRNTPTMQFPSSAIIGSKSHQELFCKNTVTRVTSLFTPSDDLFNTVDIELIKWLYARVGFYDAQFCKPYIATVLKAAEEYKLAFMMSTPELVRGMDYRFDCVIIDKDFATNASKASLKQTIGRVGRPGSSIAQIIFEDEKTIPDFTAQDNTIALFKQNLIDFKPIVQKKIIRNKFSVRSVKVLDQTPVETHDDIPDETIDETPDNWEDVGTWRKIVFAPFIPK